MSADPFLYIVFPVVAGVGIFIWSLSFGVKTSGGWKINNKESANKALNETAIAFYLLFAIPLVFNLIRVLLYH